LLVISEEFKQKLQETAEKVSQQAAVVTEKVAQTAVVAGEKMAQTASVVGMKLKTWFQELKEPEPHPISSTSPIPRQSLDDDALLAIDDEPERK
jgi:hypothetical protein